jgi:hypothetical protein
MIDTIKILKKITHHAPVSKLQACRALFGILEKPTMKQSLSEIVGFAATCDDVADIRKFIAIQEKDGPLV